MPLLFHLAPLWDDPINQIPVANLLQAAVKERGSKRPLVNRQVLSVAVLIAIWMLW
jgi:hypothetical protein